MKLLFDECLPRPLADAFAGHEVVNIEEAGFKGLRNGSLLRAATGEYDVLVTVDRGFEHQQNLSELPIAVLLIRSHSNSFKYLIDLVPDALEALDRISPREFVKVGV